MLFSGGPKDYPGLTRYLEARYRRSLPTREMRAAEIVSTILAGSAIFAALPPLLDPLLRIVLCSTGVIWLAFMASRWWKRWQARPVPSALEIEAREERKRIWKALQEKRLDVDTPVAVTELIEECARLWLRVEAALSGGFWSSKTLSAHHLRLKEQAIAAADQAMDEIVLLLRPTINPTGRKQDWKDIAENLVQRFVNGRPGREDLVPPEFAPARKLAERLHTLTTEVEAMSLRTVLDPGVAPPDAKHTIESVLGEMRAIEQAEDELDGRVQQR